MIELAHAVTHADRSALWPARHLDRVNETGALLQALDVGDIDGGHAYLALVETTAGPLVVPGVLCEGSFYRAPIARRVLSATSNAHFSVERFADVNVISDSERPIDVDQSNESVIVGGIVVMKWQRIAAPSPAPARIRAIVRAQRSGRIPADRLIPEPVALVEWHTAEVDHLIASAARYLPNAQDGWTWAVALVRDRIDEAVLPFAELGRKTAHMHIAFADLGISDATSDDVGQWLRHAQQLLTRAQAAIDGVEGQRLTLFAPRMRSELEAMKAIETTPIMAIHGDYHVGQVLRADGGLAITDFDGNPILDPIERIKPQPAARDVAGMLASIDHVARVVIHRNPDVDPERVGAWIPTAQAAFLDTYGQTLQAFGAMNLLDERLLGPFQIEQECREYVYAAEHLAHWRYVPDAVLSERYNVGGC